MVKIFLKSVLVLFALLTIVFVMWYSNVGRENLYYIEEANMYIKTFPSRETVIIAFSDKKINKFSDTLDYIKVRKGDDYGTGILLDSNKKDVFHFSGNGLRETHLIKYLEDLFANDASPAAVFLCFHSIPVIRPD